MNEKVTVFASSPVDGKIYRAEVLLLKHGSKSLSHNIHVKYCHYLKKGEFEPINMMQPEKGFILICKGWRLPKVRTPSILSRLFSSKKTRLSSQEMIEQYQSVESLEVVAYYPAIPS